MFKYVNSVSGSPNDLKEAYKKQPNITFAFHVAKVPQCARGGHQCPWDSPGWCTGAELVHNRHSSEAETTAADGSGVSVKSQPGWVGGGCSWAAVQCWREPRGWSHLFMHAVSCAQQRSLALCGEAPKAACMDQLSWASQWLLVWMCAWRNCPKITKASSIHLWCLDQAERILAGGSCRWVNHSHASSCPSTWKDGFQNAGVFPISNGWSGHISEWHERCLPNKSKK